MYIYSVVATVAILTKCHVGRSIRYDHHKTRERNSKKRNVCNGYCRNKIAVNGYHYTASPFGSSSSLWNLFPAVKRQESSFRLFIKISLNIIAFISRITGVGLAQLV
jgi:hypothetical protein